MAIHGGPTGQIETGFEGSHQYFATRGWAVLDVDYRGSTGHGRAYMTALRTQWGLLDVTDAISGAQHLVSNGLADPECLVIMGGSAGGYTVLRALTTRPRLLPRRHLPLRRGQPVHPSPQTPTNLNPATSIP